MRVGEIRGGSWTSLAQTPKPKATGSNPVAPATCAPSETGRISRAGSQAFSVGCGIGVARPSAIGREDREEEPASLPSRDKRDECTKAARSQAASGESGRGKRLKSERSAGALVSFIAGYVDTCVFVALFGLFTAQVTGNFVLIGAELVHHGVGIASKLLSAGTTRTRWPRARTRPDTLPAGRVSGRVRARGHRVLVVPALRSFEAMPTP